MVRARRPMMKARTFAFGFLIWFFSLLILVGIVLSAHLPIEYSVLGGFMLFLICMGVALTDEKLHFRSEKRTYEYREPYHRFRESQEEEAIDPYYDELMRTRARDDYYSRKREEARLQREEEYGHNQSIASEREEFRAVGRQARDMEDNLSFKWSSPQARARARQAWEPYFGPYEKKRKKRR